MSTELKDLRAALKSCIHTELEKLPKTLESLEPKDRLDILVKILPYAMPKNESISATFDEPDNWYSI